MTAEHIAALTKLRDHYQSALDNDGMKKAAELHGMTLLEWSRQDGTGENNEKMARIRQAHIGTRAGWQLNVDALNVALRQPTPASASGSSEEWFWDQVAANLPTKTAAPAALRASGERDGEVTRFEVIDHRSTGTPVGRAFVAWNCGIELSYQDGGRTLKAFVSDSAPTAFPRQDGQETP